MSKYMQSRFASLAAYVPGEQPQDKKYIKLNTNESPYPPSPGVLAVVNGDEAAKLRLYPDPECKVLTRKLATLLDVEPENVFITNGSDDSLNFAFMAFAGPDTPAVFADITYGFYKVFAQLHNIPARVIPLKPDFTLDPAEYYRAGGMVVIANPNAPTGLPRTRDELEEVIRQNPDHVVVIDEAYVDFGGESCIPLTKKYDNLLVVQTFSKSRCLAGGRLGFAVGHKDLIADLTKLKYSTNPYCINRLTLAAGEAAVDENDYYMDHCREIMDTRQTTTDALRDMGFEVLPSAANFIFAKPPKMSGEALYLALKDRGILVRYFSAPRTCDYVRITIGTPAEMAALVQAVGEICG